MPMRQPKDGDAIDNAEVGRLGLAALIGCYVGDGLVIYPGCRCGMYVVTLAEGIYHVGVTAEVGHDP